MAEELVTVEVGGQLVNIAAGSLRRGDVVILQAGDLVPADLKLIEARALEIDECEVTGELLPVVKTIAAEATAYQGSRVMRGAGKGVVAATGAQTAYGQVLQPDRTTRQPYQVRLIDRQHLWLALLCLPAIVIQLVQTNDPVSVAIVFLIFATALNFLQNAELHRWLWLSIESRRLEHAQIRVRDLSALERLGGVDTVCFDKTGVLTTRRMDITRLCFADENFDAVGEWRAISEFTRQIVTLTCALYNDVIHLEKIGLANPIDQALLAFAQAKGLDVRSARAGHQRIYDQPFDSETRFMASGFETSDSGRHYFAKGDPDVIAAMCNRYLTSSGALGEVSYEFRLTIRACIDSIVRNGDTPIILVYKSGVQADQSPAGYAFVCLLQLTNSLQAATQADIQAIASQGLRSLLLTGDKAETAANIGAESGIAPRVEAALTGRMIERMTWAEVARQAADCSVFARLTPSQKGALVRQLQQSGHCVAMVGDGSNDGITLHAADVGISFVKDSSPIARRLAGILIPDLVDLVQAIEGSRRVRRRLGQFHYVRILISAAACLSLYLWAVLA
jgi:Ca2+-transporting ATPase